MLNWSILGENCLANGGSGNSGPTTLTVTLPCGLHVRRLLYRDQCGTASSTQTVMIGNPPTVSIGPNQTVCPGANATFTATPGFSSYLWSNGATTSSVTVSASGSYSVTVTDANGCFATDTATLSNFTAPSFHGPNQTVCPGTNATFAATPGFSSDLWSNGATTNKCDRECEWDLWRDCDGREWCTGTASATLTHFPAPSVSIGPNQTVCLGANATFAATAGSNTYLWSTGATTNSVSVSGRSGCTV